MRYLIIETTDDNDHLHAEAMKGLIESKQIQARRAWVQLDDPDPPMSNVTKFVKVAGVNQ